MGNIDEISHILGQLLEFSKNTSADLTKISEKLEKIEDELKSASFVISSHDAQIKDIVAQVQSITINKAKMGAALSVVAAVGAGAYEGAGQLIDILSKFWS